MKKTILVSCLTTLFFFSKSSGQVYSPQLAGYNGVTNIYYPYGYYQGNVYNGVANGTGAFYFSDGSFYYGNFREGWWDGPGVIVSRVNGYISGCFRRGKYMGDCQNVSNPYQNNNQVERLVKKVQEEKPNNQHYKKYDPGKYKVTKVDPTTPMGRSVLGKYKK